MACPPSILDARSLPLDSIAAPSLGPSKCPRCTLSSTRMEMPAGFQLFSAAFPDCSDLCYHISSEVDLRLKLPAASYLPRPQSLPGVVFSNVIPKQTHVAASKYFYIVTRSQPLTGSWPLIPFKFFQIRSFCKLRMNFKQDVANQTIYLPSPEASNP